MSEVAIRYDVLVLSARSATAAVIFCGHDLVHFLNFEYA
jgi:hypothetical protein